MTFEEILKEVRNGKLIRRTDWRKTLLVYMQNPSHIDWHDTVIMTSTPNDMKLLCTLNKFDINFCNQFIMYDIEDRSATSYHFDGDDINASNWVVINPFIYE